MLVRAFRLSDYAEVKSLLSGVLSEECYTDTHEALAKQLSWDSELVLVAEKNQKVIGVIIGTIDNNNGYYYRIAVSTSYQRQGIGKKMIAAMKNRFTFRKVKKIRISVDSHNKPLLSLFQAVGFSENDFWHKSNLRICE